MMSPVSVKERWKWLYQFLASRELAAVLFTVFCLVMVPATFAKERSALVETLLDSLLGLVGLNLALCTVRNIRTVSRPVLVMHIGALLTFAGSFISTFGFVATVNIYEGTTTSAVYRWDLEKDMPLGADLTVKKINREYYPIPVKVGVLRGSDKVGLFVLKTGESFGLERYTVKVDALEFPSENLRLSIFNEGHLIGSADTSGSKELPADFPYDFKLVAYKNPSLKKVWLDLLLSRNSQVLAEGTSEANGPFVWERLNFYITKIERDRYGLDFAGIQIRYDPGRPYVFFGFAVMGLGSLMYFARRLYGRR